MLWLDTQRSDRVSAFLSVPRAVEVSTMVRGTITEQSIATGLQSAVVC